MRILAVAQRVGGGDSRNDELSWKQEDLARAEYMCSIQYALKCLEKDKLTVLSVIYFEFKSKVDLSKSAISFDCIQNIRAEYQTCWV